MITSSDSAMEARRAAAEARDQARSALGVAVGFIRDGELRRAATAVELAVSSASLAAQFARMALASCSDERDPCAIEAVDAASDAASCASDAARYLSAALHDVPDADRRHADSPT